MNALEFIDMKNDEKKVYAKMGDEAPNVNPNSDYAEELLVNLQKARYMINLCGEKSGIDGAKPVTFDDIAVAMRGGFTLEKLIKTRTGKVIYNMDEIIMLFEVAADYLDSIHLLLCQMVRNEYPEERAKKIIEKYAEL